MLRRCFGRLCGSEEECVYILARQREISCATDLCVFLYQLAVHKADVDLGAFFVVCAVKGVATRFAICPVPAKRGAIVNMQLWCWRLTRFHGCCPAQWLLGRPRLSKCRTVFLYAVVLSSSLLVCLVSASSTKGALCLLKLTFSSSSPLFLRHARRNSWLG